MVGSPDTLKAPQRVPLISSFPWCCQATARRFLTRTGFDEALGQTTASKGSFVPQPALPWSVGYMQRLRETRTGQARPLRWMAGRERDAATAKIG